MSGMETLGFMLGGSLSFVMGFVTCYWLMRNK